jgi:hypothetical protein
LKKSERGKDLRGSAQDPSPHRRALSIAANPRIENFRSTCKIHRLPRTSRGRDFARRRREACGSSIQCANETQETPVSRWIGIHAVRGSSSGSKFCRQSPARFVFGGKLSNGSSNYATRCFVIFARWNARTPWPRKSCKRPFFDCTAPFDTDGGSKMCAPGCFALREIFGSTICVTASGIRHNFRMTARALQRRPRAIRDAIRSNGCCNANESGSSRTRFGGCRNCSVPAYV